MMQENNQAYTPSKIQFSPSKLFFQHQNQMLQKMEFVSTMTVDLHFKYTFQEVQYNYFVEGGEFEGLNVDHDIVEQGIIYKIGFLNPKFQNVEHVLVDLKKNNLDGTSIWPLIFGLFGWLVVFFVLLWLSKYKIGQVLFRLNLVGALILLVFYGLKKGKVLYKKILKTKNVDYGGFIVNYANQTDALMLSKDVIGVLSELGEKYRISKFCYTGNCVYLLQDIHDHEGNRLDSNSKLYSEQEKAALQQRTLDFLHQEEFLSKFRL